MAINPNIALAARPVEIADPLAMYGKIAAIQGAQNQNALAQYQLGAAQRSEAATNALSQAYQAAYNADTGQIDRNKLRQTLATGGFGSQIPTVEKALGELETQALTRQKTKNELFDQSMNQIRNMWGNVRTVEDAIAVHDITHRDPIINERLKGLGVTEEMGRQQIMQAAQNPQTFGDFIKRAQLGAAKFMELNKPQFVEAGGARVPVSGLTGQRLTNVPAVEQVPLPTAVEQQKVRIAKAGASTITNVGEKAEAGEFGKYLVRQYEKLSEQAAVATRTLPSIEANLTTLNKGLKTGFGTEAKAAGARILGALGVKDAEKFATDTQTFQSNAIGAVLQKQLEQKGPQTESDARRIEQIGAELGKTKEANRFILDLAREQLRRDIEQRNFYTEWRKGPGKGSFNGAEDAWFAGEGGKSLFDRPALRKYAPGPSPVNQIPGQAPVPARAPAAAPAPAPAAIPQAAIDALRAGRGSDAQFDAIFGPGAAKRARGQ